MVSIIVPVYNSKDRLKICIESIINQTYTDIEIVLVDDGSTDGSADICNKYAALDNRISVYHQENAGASSARNKGVSLAKGKYIQFVDSDDYIAADMTEMLVKAVEGNNTLCSICGYIKISTEGEYRVELQECDVVELSELNDKCTEIFSKNIINSPCNKLYVKEKIVSYFDTELSLGEDLLFNLRYLDEIDKVSFVKGTFYFYIEKEGSLTKKYRPDSIEIAEKLYKASVGFALQHSLGDKAIKDISSIYMKSVIYGLYDIYIVSDMSSQEKEKRISDWIGKKTIQTAAKYAVMKNRQQVTAVCIIKKRRKRMLLFFLRIKQLQSFIRNKR